jgi:hypothetical protein
MSNEIYLNAEVPVNFIIILGMFDMNFFFFKDTHETQFQSYLLFHQFNQLFVVPTYIGADIPNTHECLSTSVLFQTRPCNTDFVPYIPMKYSFHTLYTHEILISYLNYIHVLP